MTRLETNNIWRLHPALTEKVYETTILLICGLGGCREAAAHTGLLAKASRGLHFLQIYRVLFNRRAVSDGVSIKAEDAISDVKRWFSQQHGRWPYDS